MEGRRHVPDDAPLGSSRRAGGHTSMPPARAGTRTLFKHYWELCVLLALQGALRSGEIWVKGSRRYANPASYLIAPEVWERERTELLKLTGKPATFAERLAEIEVEMAGYLDELEALLDDPDGPVGLDDAGELHLRPLAAEVVDPAVVVERDGVLARLPIVPLTELLIETDGEIHWSRHLTHAGGGSPRHPPLEHQRNLYAAILAQACNFGSTRMAELTGISADTIDWTTQWYLREGDAAGREHRRRQRALPPPDRSTARRRHAVLLRRAAPPDAREVADRPSAVAVLRPRGPDELHPRLRPALDVRDADHRLHRARRDVHAR